jgi:hypothetical protein
MLLRCLERHERAHFLDRAPQISRDRFDFHAPCFDLGEIEDVVDDSQQ